MIDVKEMSREMIVITVRPTPDDSMYMGCMWMTVYIDMVAWRLMVDSDCGAYVHCWPNEDELHNFRSALAGYLMDEDYILGKISQRSKFDGQGTMENIEQAYCDEPETLEMVREKLRDATTEFDFYTAFLDDDMPDELYEEICHDYPCYAKRVAHLLKEYVAPMLRKEA